MINKLQGALEEFARGDDEAAIDNLKGGDGDAFEIINNVLSPAETDAEIIVDEVLEKIQIETSQQQEDENDDVSSEAIRYNSKGESIENIKAQTGNAVGCHETKKKSLEVAPQPVEKSSSVEEHVQRFDSDGNSIEKFVEPSTESEEFVEIKRKNKKVTTSNEIRRLKKEEVNNALSKQVVDDQLDLDMRQMESDESAFNEDDDIPVITLPMLQILKQYQRMAQQAAGVFSEETEEYSDEIEVTTNPLDNPRIRNILRRISNERKREKLEQLDPKERRKPAALRVLEELQGSESDEDL